MSRTTLCMVTAAVVAGLSVAVMIARKQVMGDEVRLPAGPGTWKVTLVVRGEMQGDARLTTLTPLDVGRQHVLRESYKSEQMLSRPPEARHPQRRQVLWSRRGGTADGAFRLHHEFVCSIESRHQSAAHAAADLYVAPRPGEHLALEEASPPDNAALADVARELTQGLERPLDQAESLYRFVAQEIDNEPSDGGGSLRPAECLTLRAGDCVAQARLLVSLLRRRGIPARVVVGLTLTKGPEQMPHAWVEAWLDEHWKPMCPYHQHFGRVPPTYLVLGFGDQPAVRGKNVGDLHYAYLVEKVGPASAGGHATRVQRFFRAISLYRLPPPEQRLVEFLLLLPVAALVICVFRNVIGLSSFGTFAPALLGLAFREGHSLPGLLVFVAVVLTGWLIRRVLNHYHLLQVPRSAFLLSLVVLILISGVVAANMLELPATKYIAIFPIVILTGMIERFWTLETEDSTSSSFRTLVCTVFIATTVALVVSIPALTRHLFRYPETVGLIMAAQLMLGRYTGYRLMELWRFRELVRS